MAPSAKKKTPGDLQPAPDIKRTRVDPELPTTAAAESDTATSALPTTAAASSADVRPTDAAASGIADDATDTVPAPMMMVPLPMPESTKVDDAALAGPVMQQLYPFVMQSLLKYMGTGGFAQFAIGLHLHEHSPLIISNVKDELVSYKAPWDVHQMKTSLESTSMYEAGGNLVWVDWRPPPVGGKAENIAGMAPRWSQVKEVAERYFSQAAMVVSGAGGRRRIVFPVRILVHAESLEVAMNSAGSACSMAMLVGHVGLGLGGRNA